jgi:hypothetical protein
MRGLLYLESTESLYRCPLGGLRHPHDLLACEHTEPRRTDIRRGFLYVTAMTLPTVSEQPTAKTSTSFVRARRVRSSTQSCLKEGGNMEITARYKGYCNRCHYTVWRGEKVWLSNSQDLWTAWSRDLLLLS